MNNLPLVIEQMIDGYITNAKYNLVMGQLLQNNIQTDKIIIETGEIRNRTGQSLYVRIDEYGYSKIIRYFKYGNGIYMDNISNNIICKMGK